MIDEGLPPGTVVEGYVIERVLGQGGFAITYLAHDAHLVESRYALKEYFPQDLARRTQRVEVAAPAPRAQAYREGLERFIDEARTLIRLPPHPGIVRAHRYLPVHGTAYLVMDYVEGQSLKSALEQRERAYWSEARVRALALQLLEALRGVHGAGVWHRDLNPSNVLLRDDERPVLIDFGASRLVQAARTRTGQRVATSGYSPPEQYGPDYGEPGAWSDLYALGATLYEVVTGVQPAESLARLAARLKGKDPLVRAVEAASGRYSAELLAWIDRHLQLEETARPQTAEQSMALLLGLPVAAAGPVAKTAPVASAQRFGAGKVEARVEAPPIARPRAGIARRWVALGLVFAACAGIWGGFLLGGRQGGGSVVEPEPAQAAQTQNAEPAQSGTGPAELPAETVIAPSMPLPAMVELPSGNFMMGTPDGEEGDADERPVREVRIKAFRLGKFEVTRGEFGRFVSATGYRTDAERNTAVGGSAAEGCFAYKGGTDFGWKAGTSWRDPGFAQEDDHPVVCVSWNDAQEYVKWLNRETGRRYRLPSEAEQEYAIRATSRTPYAWGSDANGACAYANVADASAKGRFSGWTTVSCNDGSVFTRSVGRYQANGLGLHDTVGNVWEWGQDCYRDSYPDAPVDGSAVEANGCEWRVLRGAAWSNKPAWLRSASRDWTHPSYRYNTIGFRLAEDL